MYILPSCAYYLRRLLKQTVDSHKMPDLLQTVKDSSHDLKTRLHYLYPNDYNHEKVVLRLEQLIYSHQHASSHGDQMALQDITHQVLWWLGYGVNIHPINAKVFVVDDAIETLKLVTTLLTKAGYKTDSALNGQLALEKVGVIKPDLILLDINLPDIDGYQVYEKLQESSNTANIPVVFISGVDNIEPVHNPQTRVGYLVKPFKLQSLLKCVSRHLKVRLPNETLTDDVLANELKNRQQQAQRLICLSDNYRANDFEFYNPESESIYFFRTTLDGRYLRVSQALAELCGYDSAEAMISNVTNLWSQIYDSASHQEQWNVCFQSPNKPKTLATKIRTRQDKTLEVTENISLVQDSYNRNLFYQGYIRLA